MKLPVSRYFALQWVGVVIAKKPAFGHGVVVEKYWVNMTAGKSLKVEHLRGSESPRAEGLQRVIDLFTALPTP